MECSVRQPAKQQPAGLAPLSPLSARQSDRPKPQGPSHTRGERPPAPFWRERSFGAKRRSHQGYVTKWVWEVYEVDGRGFHSIVVCGGSDASAIYGGSNWRTVEALTNGGGGPIACLIVLYYTRDTEPPMDELCKVSCRQSGPRSSKRVHSTLGMVDLIPRLGCFPT